MRPIPQSILIILLAALCGLCAMQWWRESTLRELAFTQRTAALKLTAEQDDITARMKVADGEILRLTAALTDLRTLSVSKQVHEDVIQANIQIRETVEKQNATIKEQNEAIAKQNAAMELANENIRKLAAARDDLAKRLNEVIALYNKAVQEKH